MTVDANGARGGNLNRMLVYSLPNSQTRREQCRHGNFTLTQFLQRQGLATGAAWRFRSLHLRCRRGLRSMAGLSRSWPRTRQRRLGHRQSGAIRSPARRRHSGDGRHRAGRYARSIAGVGTSAAALTRLNRVLALEVKSLPRLKNLFVYGEDGRWLASSVANFSPDLNNSHREYFQRMKPRQATSRISGFRCIAGRRANGSSPSRVPSGIWTAVSPV